MVTESGNNPVALLFAGSDTRTLANPIGAVLQRFGVTIDNGSGGSTNVPPTANFSFATADLTATFTDQSSDSDGSVVGWSWTFGDGATSTQQNPSHTYAASGTYTVGLTVTDDDGATGSTSKNVTVTAPAGDEIVLTATGRKVRTQRYIDLSWTGADGSSVDVYRNGSKFVTTENDGFYSDSVARGTYTYKLFDGTKWSNEVTIKI
ncbi:PKD domain-containing protein [candidate division KSB1 bacterium]|nr:PKD domain-containing protein [candidate division KSB1 bacterium]